MICRKCGLEKPNGVYYKNHGFWCFLCWDEILTDQQISHHKLSTILAFPDLVSRAKGMI